MRHTLLVATTNTHKLGELRQLLADLPLDLIAPTDVWRAPPTVVEDGVTFAENARKKAVSLARASGLLTLADDSGLEVDALNGAPGVRSARYAGPGAGDAANVAKLLEALADVPEAGRTARFQCAIVLLRRAEDPTPIVCQGTWEGRITTAPRGANGFGYDPVFFVPSHGCTAAELPAEAKNALSHRGQALRALMEALRARLG